MAKRSLLSRCPSYLKNHLVNSNELPNFFPVNIISKILRAQKLPVYRVTHNSLEQHMQITVLQLNNYKIKVMFYIQ